MKNTNLIWGKNPNDRFAAQLEKTTAKVKERMAAKDRKAAECRMTREELAAILTRAETF